MSQYRVRPYKLNVMSALGTLSVGTRHGRTAAVYHSMNVLNEARTMSEFVGYPFPLPLKDPPGQGLSYLESFKGALRKDLCLSCPNKRPCTTLSNSDRQLNGNNGAAHLANTRRGLRSGETS